MFEENLKRHFLRRPASGSDAWKTDQNDGGADASDTISIHTVKTSITGDTEELISEEDPPKGCWHSFTHCVGGTIFL